MIIPYNEFGVMGIILCFEIFGVMIIRHTGIRCNEMIPFKPLRYPVNSLYNKCEMLKFGDGIKLSNFLYAHDNINKGNLPTTLCAGITFSICT